MNALLLVLAMTASTLVLRTGERIVVEGDVREERGVITFRSAGVLYSLPADELLNVAPIAVEAADRPVVRLRGSEEDRKRIIAQLEQNHDGTAPPEQRILSEPPGTPKSDEMAAERGTEAEWRAQARMHEEHIKRAKEDLALLHSEIDQMQSEINSLFTLGYRPIQFEYQTTRLARARERIPYAELEVTRAQRAWDDFREDARRAGVLPGWLR
jgi:hypothetical protein